MSGVDNFFVCGLTVGRNGQARNPRTRAYQSSTSSSPGFLLGSTLSPFFLIFCTMISAPAARNLLSNTRSACRTTISSGPDRLQAFRPWRRSVDKHIPSHVLQHVHLVLRHRLFEYLRTGLDESKSRPLPCMLLLIDMFACWRECRARQGLG